MRCSYFLVARFLLLAGLAGALSRAEAQTQMVSNLAEPSDPGDFFSASPSLQVAQSFTTGSAATTLSDVSLAFSSGGSGTGFTLSLYSNGSSAPGISLETLSGSSSPTDLGILTFTSNAATPLAPNSTYWVVAASSSGQFNLNDMDSSNETSSIGWTIGNGLSFFSSGSWFGLNHNDLRFSVSASPIPEPGTYAALAGLAMLGFGARRRCRSRLRVATR